MKSNNAGFVFTILIVFSFFTLADADWKQTNGPEGGALYSLQAFNNTLFVSAYPSGLFRSTNYGGKWTAVRQSTPESFITLIGGYKSKIFGVSNTKTYKSTDNGDSWTLVHHNIADSIITSRVISDSTIYLGTKMGVYYSLNDGATWLKQNSGLTDSNLISLIATEGLIFAITAQKLFRFDTHILQWVELNNEPVSNYINSIALKGLNLFIGTVNGLWKSPDTGKSWKKISPNGPPWESMIFSPIGSTIFALVNSVFSRSLDSGKTWTECTTGMLNRTAYSLTQIGSQLFAINGDGVYTSKNNGASWERINSGIVSTSITGLAKINSTIFASTFFGGIAKSADGGNTWTDLKNDSELFFIHALYSNGKSLFGGKLGGEIFVSTDLGDSWKNLNAGMILKNDNRPEEFIEKKGRLYLGNRYGIFRLNSLGNTWEKIDSAFISCLATDENRIYACLNDGIKISQNNDSNWIESHDIFQKFGAYSISVLGSKIYVGTFRGVFQSVDTAKTWTMSGSGIIDSAIYCFTQSGANLFAGGTNGKVYQSTDSGSTWASISAGLKIEYPIRVLTVSDSNLYAGTDGEGVWIRPFSEIGLGIKSQKKFSKTGFENTILANLSFIKSKVTFELTHAALIDLSSFAINGAKIQTLLLGEFQQGIHSLDLSHIKNTHGKVSVRLLVNDKAYHLESL